MEPVTSSRSMPKPLVALPWGSRSTTSTRSPRRTSEVPRFTTVVVLPTPPFWLVQASVRLTRGGANGDPRVLILPSEAGRGWRGGDRQHRRGHVAAAYASLRFTGNLTVKHMARLSALARAFHGKLDGETHTG